MMPPRSWFVVLAVTTAIVVAFTLAVVLDRPAARSTPAAPAAAASSGSPSASSSSAGSSSPVGPSASGFDGVALPAHVRAPDFTLTDQAGRRISLAQFRGQVVVLVFVYSTCGPTCFLIAQQVRGALDELPRRPPVLFVSINPEADTPAHIGRFLASVSLSGRVHYLTGSLSELRPVWSSYGASQAIGGSAQPASKSALIESSTAVFLIDRRGFERVLYTVEQLTPEALVHDIERLQSEP